MAGGGTPGSADEFVAYAEQQERHPLAGLKAENYRAHPSIMTARRVGELGCAAWTPATQLGGLPSQEAQRAMAPAARMAARGDGGEKVAFIG